MIYDKFAILFFEKLYLFDAIKNKSFFYLDFLSSNDSNISDGINSIPLNKINDIILLLKINCTDVDKKIYFVYEKINTLYEKIIKKEKECDLIPKKEGLIQIKLRFNNVIRDFRNMFCHCENLLYVDISHLNSSYLTDMSDMFYFCENLKEINFSSLNTEKVNDMSYMFCGCYSLEKLDLSKLDTKNVKNMRCMFMNCRNLKEIDLKNFNTKKVTNMRSMYKNCKSLKKLDLTSFNTENVLIMNYMFLQCGLPEINLIFFNFKNIKKDNMILMFDFNYNIVVSNKDEFYNKISSHTFFYSYLKDK